jgi:citronellol/citronellal dehydrogenase
MARFDNRVAMVTGAASGIGKAIAHRLAAEGACVVVADLDLQKATDAAAEIGSADVAVGVAADVSDGEAVAAAFREAVLAFGGVDLVVNNASAINLAPMRELPVKRFDLMQQINARGTFVVTQACLPQLRESEHAHVLTLSPPLSVDRRWLAGHSAYTLSKMGMTMITLGVAADEAQAGIGANCLWPRTIIATAAVQNLLGGDEAMARARTPEILADAAYEILVRDPRSTTGNTFIDDEVLAEAGITDLSGYAAADSDLVLDIFVDGWPEGVPA